MTWSPLNTLIESFSTAGGLATKCYAHELRFLVFQHAVHHASRLGVLNTRLKDEGGSRAQDRSLRTCNSPQSAHDPSPFLSPKWRSAKTAILKLSPENSRRGASESLPICRKTRGPNGRPASKRSQALKTEEQMIQVWRFIACEGGGKRGTRRNCGARKSTKGQSAHVSSSPSRSKQYLCLCTNQQRE